MSVKMTGGSSGNREDGLPPVPSAGSSQPVQRTQGSGVSSNVNWGSQPTGNRERDASPAMPTSGGDATGTDLADPGATGGDSTPASIFRGSRVPG